MSWKASYGGTGIAYIVPVDDLREHDNKNKDCWCRPLIDTDLAGNVMLCHQSMDRREEYENGRKPN